MPEEKKINVCSEAYHLLVLAREGGMSPIKILLGPDERRSLNEDLELYGYTGPTMWVNPQLAKNELCGLPFYGMNASGVALVTKPMN